MFDLSGSLANSPGLNEMQPNITPYQKLQKLEEALAREINDSRFIPYLQLHEFEVILFSNLAEIDKTLKAAQVRSRLKKLQSIRNSYSSPEEINDSPETAPSKRLEELYPEYDTAAFGPRIAEPIGLQTIRRECRHVDEWMKKIESLQYPYENCSMSLPALNNEAVRFQF